MQSFVSINEYFSASHLPHKDMRFAICFKWQSSLNQVAGDIEGHGSEPWTVATAFCHFLSNQSDWEKYPQS